jgi:hypothetical protein
MTLRISYAKDPEPVTVATIADLDAELDRIAAKFADKPDVPPLVALETVGTNRTMLVGLRGSVGVLNYVDLDDSEGGYVSKGTDPNADTPPYFYFGSWTGLESNAEIPGDQVRAAAREFLTTGERPTCVVWQD